MRAVTMTLSLAACAPGNDARYIGALPGCGLGASTLAHHADHVAFTPGDGALVLQGAVGPDGGFAATLNTQPPGKPEYLLRVSGRIAGDQARVEYVTPRCHATATLTRAATLR
jgi:hypothetical protein